MEVSAGKRGAAGPAGGAGRAAVPGAAPTLAPRAGGRPRAASHGPAGRAMCALCLRSARRARPLAVRGGDARIA